MPRVRGPLGRAIVEKVARQLAASFTHVPTLAELRARAEAMFARSPSMDDIVARARELLLQAAGLPGMDGETVTA